MKTSHKLSRLILAIEEVLLGLIVRFKWKGTYLTDDNLAKPIKIIELKKYDNIRN